MKPRLAISFSGGRSSAVMTKLCFEQYADTHEIVVTFANTGCEHPATLDFVKACDENWGFNTVWLEAVVGPPGVGIRHRVVTYETASRNGEPFEALISKYGIPNQVDPHCSERLKMNVSRDYLKSIGWIRSKSWIDHDTAIGIRADEVDRISQHAAKERFIYPLIDLGITKSKVNSIMAQQPWDLKIPNDAFGNCVWCWKKTYRKLYTLAKLDLSVFNFPARMEREHGTTKAGPDYAATSPDGRRYFYRGHRSTADIIQDSKTRTGMALYTDQVQSTIFDELLDIGGACSDGCEVGHD